MKSINDFPVFFTFAILGKETQAFLQKCFGTCKAVVLIGEGGDGLFSEPLNPQEAASLWFLRGHSVNEPQCGAMGFPLSLKSSARQAKWLPDGSLSGSPSHLDLELLLLLEVRRCRMVVISSQGPELSRAVYTLPLAFPCSCTHAPFGLCSSPVKGNWEPFTYCISYMVPKSKMNNVKQAEIKKGVQGENSFKNLCTISWEHCFWPPWLCFALEEYRPSGFLFLHREEGSFESC